MGNHIEDDFSKLVFEIVNNVLESTDTSTTTILHHPNDNVPISKGVEMATPNSTAVSATIPGLKNTLPLLTTPSGVSLSTIGTNINVNLNFNKLNESQPHHHHYIPVVSAASEKIIYRRWSTNDDSHSQYPTKESIHFQKPQKQPQQQLQKIQNQFLIIPVNLQNLYQGIRSDSNDFWSQYSGDIEIGVGVGVSNANTNSLLQSKTNGGNNNRHQHQNGHKPAHSKKSLKNNGTKFCTFCKNKESPAIHADHLVYENGKITCPILLECICNYCGKKGHTMSHCPTNTARGAIINMVKVYNMMN